MSWRAFVSELFLTVKMTMTGDENIELPTFFLLELQKKTTVVSLQPLHDRSK